MFERDTEIEIHYPTSTHVRYIDRPPAVRRRQLRILRVRDLVQHPLTPAEFMRRPWIRRSRYLVLANESGRLKFRQFYLGCATEFEAPSQLRIGLYAPDGEKPLELLARGFDPTILERKKLIRLLDRWRDREFGGLLLRVFADDLRLRRNE